MLRRIDKKILFTDLAAVGVAAAIFIYFSFLITRAVNTPDDSFCLGMVQRFAHGDRLLIEEWGVEQFCTILLWIPYHIYVSLFGNGTTEGLILAMRILYITINLALYCFLYIRLRRFGLYGLTCAALCCTYVPIMTLSLTYYSMALQGMIIVCTIFCLKENGRPFSAAELLFAGVVYSASVIAQPSLLALWFLYGFFVLLRSVLRRCGIHFAEAYDFLLSGRTYGIFSITVLLGALFVFCVIAFGSDLSEAIRSLPDILSNTEYDFGTASGTVPIFAQKLLGMVHLYNGVNIVGCALSITAAVVCRIQKKKGREISDLPVLLLSGLFALTATLYGLVQFIFSGFDVKTASLYLSTHFLPIVIFGLVCHILTSVKSPRLFLLWCAGLFVNISVDLASNIQMCFGGSISFIAAVLLFERKQREYGAALKSAKKQKKGAQGGMRKCLCLCLTLTLFSDIAVVGGYAAAPIVEKVNNRLNGRQPLNAVISCGPHKGIRTTERIKTVYEGYMADMDRIKKLNVSGGSVLIFDLHPICGLALNEPYAAYSLWTNEEEIIPRTLRYYEVHPEKRPEFVYIPYYEEYSGLPYKEIEPSVLTQKFSFFETACRFQKEEGRSGAILHVQQWFDVPVVSRFMEDFMKTCTGK